MVETITPVVHGGRRGRWGIAVALHVAGASAGAAALGAALGLAGAVLGAPWGGIGLWLAAAVAVAYAGRELMKIAVPLPDRKRQVPEWWRTFFGPLTASFLYGLGLGVGFLTYLRHGTLVAVAAVAVVAGDPLAGALVLVPFGVGRSLTVIAAVPGVTSEAVSRVMARLDAWALSALPKRVNGAVLLAVAGVATLAALRAPGAASADRVGVPGLAAELLAATFAWAALTKAVRFTTWLQELRGYRLPGTEVLAVAVPLAELSVPGLVIAGSGTTGAVLSVLLLASFSVAILRARRFHGDRLPCGCFGKRVRRDFRTLLARNALLTGVAMASLADPVVALPTLGPAATVPLLLVGLGVGLTLFLAREGRRLASSRTS
jgi:hypothetical protein